MTNRARRIGVRVLLVIGGVLAALSLIAGHLNRNLLDGPTFAENVDDLRRDPAVATQVGRSISTQLARAQPDLVALRPLLEVVAVGVAGSDLLSGPVRTAARQAHQLLTEPDADAVVLRIADAGAVVLGVVGALAPERSPAASEVAVTLASVRDQAFASQTVAVAHVLGLLSWLLPLLAAVCLVAAVLLSDDRWRGAATAGVALVVAAGGVGLALVIGGLVVRGFDDDTLGGAVAQAGWNVFVRPMWWEVVGLAAVGLAIAATSGSAAPIALLDRVARVRASLARRPSTPAAVAIRAVAVGVVGIVAIANPAGVVELAVLVAGLVLVLWALSEIARLGATARARTATSAAADTSGDVRPRRRMVPVGVGVVAALVLLGGVVWFARPGDDVTAGADPGAGEGCNGHAELCDRRFNEVAYAASHNAMSAATEPGWFLPEHADPIRVQLDQGVRALLIDVWPGRQAGTVVRTDPAAHAEALAIAEEELGPHVVAAALRVTDSVAGAAVGPEARYLCHGLCEVGSTPFLEMLDDLRVWLAANPDEVVTLFIEDHVDAASIAADIEAAGLLSSMHTPGEQWPTLGEMIASGRRLVVMLEEGDGGADAPWLVNGFEFTQDTPYTFPTLESFGCEPNRGPPDAPLLLLNHWLADFTALVSAAETVNTRTVLLGRAEQCRAERGQIPNFVAVNYVTIGDLFAVVDELNGVG